MARIDDRKVWMQFISHFTERYSYLDSIAMALDGGCQWVQLRVKRDTLALPDDSDERYVDILREMALKAKHKCRAYDATFIIDDNVALVKEIGADGVHLGKKDMPVAEARKILGPDVIIGGTANTFEDVRMHYDNGADYIGCGPFRFTTTKSGLAPVLGLEGYCDIVNSMRSEGIDIPIVAIGGITAEDIPAIMQTGVSGIALSGTVLRAENPVDEMKRLINLVSNEKPELITLL